jgi:hypothetical protein
MEIIFWLLVFGFGVICGFNLKKEQHPPAVDILTNQVEKLEEDLAYYKGLCKWHVERNKK